MDRRRSRYKEMERYVTYALLTALVFFVLFLIASGFGIGWLKAISAIVAILISGLCLVFLYLNKELLRRRSLWMTAAAASMVICILFSLILQFPSPSPYNADPVVTASQTAE